MSNLVEAGKTIAVLCPGEDFSSRWVKNWTQLYTHLLLRRGFRVLDAWEFISDVSACRNSLANQLLRCEVQPDFVLWIDDDNIIDPEMFERLYDALLRTPEAQAMAAWCWCQADQFQYGAMISCGRLTESGNTIPFSPDDLVETIDGKKQGRMNPMRVGYTGFPAILMRAELMRSLGPNPFTPFVGPQYDFGCSGEDVAFCIRCREKGFPIYIHPMAQVPHLKRQPIEPKHLLQFAQPTQEKEAKETPYESWGEKKECAA